MLQMSFIQKQNVVLTESFALSVQSEVWGVALGRKTPKCTDLTAKAGGMARELSSPRGRGTIEELLQSQTAVPSKFL